MLTWLFRNRSTGRITVAQRPNVPLALFVVLVVVRWLVSPAGAASSVLDACADAALAWWSIDEIVRGVNPFRRILGATVLALTLAGAVRTLL